VVKLADSDDHGHLAVVESKDVYLQTLTKYIIWIQRLSSMPDVPEQRHGQQVITYAANPTTDNLHLLLRALFAPFATSTERSSHSMAWFVRITSRREGGSFVSLAELRHRLVHLVYSMRLMTFNELSLNPQIAYTSVERNHILASVRMRYPASSSFS